MSKLLVINLFCSFSLLLATCGGNDPVADISKEAAVLQEALGEVAPPVEEPVVEEQKIVTQELAPESKADEQKVVTQESAPDSKVVEIPVTPDIPAIPAGNEIPQVQATPADQGIPVGVNPIPEASAAIVPFEIKLDENKISASTIMFEGGINVKSSKFIIDKDAISVLRGGVDSGFCANAKTLPKYDASADNLGLSIEFVDINGTSFKATGDLFGPSKIIIKRVPNSNYCIFSVGIAMVGVLGNKASSCTQIKITFTATGSDLETASATYSWYVGSDLNL